MNAKANNSKNSSLVITVLASKLYKLVMDNPFIDLKKYIDDCTKLLDNEGFGSQYGANNENYTTNVYESGEMIWSIKLDPDHDERGYGVVLDFINQEIKRGEKGYFTENPIKVGDNGTILGKVSSDIDPNSPPESYTINFQVLKNGLKSTPVLTIDPRLKINQ
ncbi:hypothetical protein [Winogradskyella sp. MIT101101]|uniref:hypothetical protein n=1 Tax=Winogradskyella sp. MIT101101 TaxID=3098297 RepID=UPI00399BDA21